MIQTGSMANAMEGMHHFEPMLAFEVGPASSLMAAISEYLPFFLFLSGGCPARYIYIYMLRVWYSN
jgi:hypothetical protein